MELIKKIKILGESIDEAKFGFKFQISSVDYKNASVAEITEIPIHLIKGMHLCFDKITCFTTCQRLEVALSVRIMQIL